MSEAVGALTGAGAKWALDKLKQKRALAVERQSDWTAKYVAKLMRRAADFERRLEHVERFRSRVEANFADPSFWEVFDNAGAAAGTTQDDAKHDILSRAVLERLASAPDSTTAVASSEAVGLVGRLSTTQIDLLALTALMLAVRPSHRSVDKILKEIDESGDNGNRQLQEQLAQEVSSYLRWLEAQLPKLRWAEPPTDVVTAHLIAVGAVIFDRDNERDIEKVLRPWTQAQPQFFSMHAQQPIHDFLHTNMTGAKLTSLWLPWMQHVTPTPAGLLIGVAAADSQTEEFSTVNIEALDYLSDVRNAGKEIWDGDR